MSVRSFVKNFILRKTVLTGVAALLIIAAASFFLGEPLVATLALIVTAGFVAIEALFGFNEAKKDGMTRNSPLLSGLSLGFVNADDEPIAMVGEQAGILWYNKAFA